MVLLIILLYFGIQFLLQVKIKAIVVKGTDYVKDSSIIKDAGLTDGIEFLGFKESEICARIKENPLIKNCQIKRKINFSIEITVEENIPLLYYNNESSILLSDGTRVAETSNTYGIPTLINFVPEKILKEFLEKLSEVKIDVVRSISEIEYTPSASKEGVYIDEKRFMLLMNDGNTIYINNKRLDVLNHYEAVYASIGDKKGTFNFDCDFGNYPFKEYEVLPWTMI